MIKALMIEEDEAFALNLGDNLLNFNISVVNYKNPLEALKLNFSDFDCLILGLNLPEIDGFEVCKIVREKSNIPILISSIRNDISDEAIAFKLGADDYLAKPYDLKKLAIRVENLIRRQKQYKKFENKIQNQTFFKINEKSHEISYKDQSLKLTPAEYEVLECLISNHSHSLSREILVENCKSLKDTNSKSLDVIIGRLRGKINDSSKSPKHIFSVRGVGYKLIG